MKSKLEVKIHWKKKILQSNENQRTSHNKKF